MPDSTERIRIGQTDLKVTRFGFGSAPIGNLLREVSEEDAQGALKAAFDAGVRYFDTAPFYGYGLSENRVGLHLIRNKKSNLTS